MSYPEPLTLITCTGNRPEAFTQCQRMMMRQLYPLDRCQWIVVDDGETQSPSLATLAFGCVDVIRPRPLWAPGMGSTLKRNLLEALKLVRNERIVIIEDDDWYAPHWLAVQNSRLDQANLVGEMETIYYHIQSRGWVMLDNALHGSLFQTALRLDVENRNKLAEIVATGDDRFVDLELWNLTYDSRWAPTRKLFPRSNFSLGIKGLPGRPGLGIGHRTDTAWTDDSDGQWLLHVVGMGDAEFYLHAGRQ